MKTHFVRSALPQQSSGPPVVIRNWLLLAAIALMTLSTTRLVNAQGLLYIVNTTSDTVVFGACENGNAGCSLRGAMEAANFHVGADGIDFGIPTSDPGFDPVTGSWTINLTTTLPSITDGVGIAGPGADVLIVRRNTGGDYRIFTVSTSGTVTFSGLTISNGSDPGGQGGGIEISDINGATVNVTGCTLSGNSVSESSGVDGFGGGIANSGPSTLNVTNCTFSGNSAIGSVGGGIVNSGIMNVTNSTFNGNFASNGGGIVNIESVTNVANVTSCTFSDNSADGVNAFGGAILNLGLMNLTNSTLTGNSASSGGSGGGLCNFGSSEINIKSSIIAQNTASSLGPDVFVESGSVTSEGFNLIGKNDGAATSFPAGNPNANNDIVGTAAFPVNPKLDANGLQDNGGPPKPSRSFSAARPSIKARATA